MMGAKPSLDTSTTVTTDVIPVNVVVGGQTFSATGKNGNGVLSATTDSPVFNGNDYTSTAAHATDTVGGSGPGGTCPSVGIRPKPEKALRTRHQPHTTSAAAEEGTAADREP